MTVHGTKLTKMNEIATLIGCLSELICSCFFLCLCFKSNLIWWRLPDQMWLFLNYILDQRSCLYVKEEKSYPVESRQIEKKTIRIKKRDWQLCTCGYLCFTWTYWYSLQALLQSQVQSGFLQGQTPLPPGYPGALWRHAFVLWNSCLSRISALPASGGCQQCPRLPVSMETSEMSACCPSHHNSSLITTCWRLWSKW